MSNELRRGLKTERVRDQIFTAILRGEYQPGDRLPTERAMADMTGTSRVTVRRAYGELEEAGIIKRVQGSGANVATHHKGSTGKANHVALLTSVVEPFALDFLRTLDRTLAEYEALFVLRLTGEDPVLEEAAACQLVSKGIRNLVVWPSGKDFARDTFRRLRVLGVNMVFFDRMIPGPYADFVGLDNEDAIDQLLDAARADGRTQFVHITHDGLGVESDLQREQAFIEYCMRYRLPYSVRRTPWQGDAVGMVREHRDAWFPQPEQTAVICVNDEVALDVRAATDDRLSVYGINGSTEALQHGITSVRQPMPEMAEKVIQFLMAQAAEGEKWKAVTHLMKGELIRPNPDESPAEAPPEAAAAGHRRR